jgi:NAD(P)-dependent dehydrogenase (short-subunit alcohol dehydrogenase family)
MPLYVASKHAVLGLSRTVALEYARKNIRINTVCPGVVQTDMYQRFLDVRPDLAEGTELMHPMGRTGQAEEVASAVYWLCTGATWTTGQAITVDGGFTAQ